MPAPEALPEADWLGFCRRAVEAARQALLRFPTTAERGVETSRGEGGDMTLVIDRAAEDAVFAELEALGLPVTAISEERGELELNGGGPVRIVIDPVDGSLNAKRRLPFACVSIAVASGPRMPDVQVGYVAELEPASDWWAVRGQGAYRDGERLPRLEPGPLELVGLEVARPPAVAQAAAAIAELGAKRVRALGSVAVTMCLVAAGRLDAMLSLRDVRSVDAAAAQLLVEEAGGAVSFPADDSLSLAMRSPVAAARDSAMLERVLGAAWQG
ncbi:MAG TPA: inositol monophosphatase family protein [Thermoleophilaceae bacterium]|nr:inositol monophosphatase family protein [Thermoleophilaceae bacterium]